MIEFIQVGGGTAPPGTSLIEWDRYQDENIALVPLWYVNNSACIIRATRQPFSRYVAANLSKSVLLENAHWIKVEALTELAENFS